MIDPKSEEDLQNLVRDGVQEDLHLDYKASNALTKRNGGEIAKDASAFANSDGGTLIYGIEEKGHLPVGVDGGQENSEVSREWIEQCINSNIAPRIAGIRIRQIPLSQGRSAFSIVVPKSYAGPHQERRNKRYYKRYNFVSEPMEDYEIADVRARSSIVPPLMSIDCDIRHHTLCMIIIENIGDIPAHDVQFDFPDHLSWRRNSESPPPIIQHGVKYFGPGKRFEMMYNTAPVILSESSTSVSTFDVGVSYVHPYSGERKSDRFHLSFRDYLGTWALKSDIQEQGENLEKAIQKLVAEVKGLRSELSPLKKLTSATGLDLSITSLRNIRSIVAGSGELEKLDAEAQDGAVFKEALGVGWELAWSLGDFFRRSSNSAGIREQIEQMDDETMDRLRRCFRLTEDPGSSDI